MTNTNLSLTRLNITLLLVLTLLIATIPFSGNAQENMDPYQALTQESISDINAVIIQYSVVKVGLTEIANTLTPSDSLAAILQSLSQINTRGLTEAETSAIARAINNEGNANTRYENWNEVAPRIETMHSDLSQVHQELLNLLN